MNALAKRINVFQDRIVQNDRWKHVFSLCEWVQQHCVTDPHTSTYYHIILIFPLFQVKHSGNSFSRSLARSSCFGLSRLPHQAHCHGLVTLQGLHQTTRSSSACWDWSKLAGYLSSFCQCFEKRSNTHRDKSRHSPPSNMSLKFLWVRIQPH